MKGFITQGVMIAVGLLLTAALTLPILNSKQDINQEAINVGGDPFVFTSSQVGTNPQADYILSTNGATSTWIANTASGGGLATSSTWTTGDLVQVTDNGTVNSIATSSLAINTDNLVEGLNLFHTLARVQAILIGGYNAIFGNATTTDLVVTGNTSLATTTILNDHLAVGASGTTGVVNGTSVTGNIGTWIDNQTNHAEIGLGRAENTSASVGATLYGGRSRGTLASPTIVQSGDNLLDIVALGNDGTDYAISSRIDMEVDGTPGANDMPGRIVFRTSADGTQSATEAMRISSDNSVSMTGTLGVTGTSTLATTTATNLSIGSLSGFLKATAGAVATALIDLTADVTSILPVANGGTGTTSLTNLVSSSTINATPYTAGYGLTASTTAASGLAWTSLAGGGTVTSVDMSVPTGLTISGNPITGAGTLALGLDTGYVIPLTASTTEWAAAYASTTEDRWLLNTGDTGNGAYTFTGTTTLATTTVTGTLTVDGPASGANGAFDLIVGSGDYGGINLGNTGIYSSSFSASNLNLDKTVLFRQQGNLGISNDPGIEFAWMEGANTVRLAIPESGAGNATWNPRSVIVAGPYSAAIGNNGVLCSQWGFINLDCDTSTTGPDFGVLDDTEILGSLYVGENINATGTVTAVSSVITNATSTNLFATNLNWTNLIGTVDISSNTNLTVGATGIELSNDDIALSSGYNIPLTASTTEWATAYGWGNHALAGYLTNVAVNDLTDAIADSFSIFIGSGAGANDDGTNNSNTGVGINALNAITSGVQNTALGYNTLDSITTANFNTAIGSTAGSNLTSGNTNVILGDGAGNSYGGEVGNLTSLSNSFLLGRGSQPLANGDSNTIVIGVDAIGKGSNTVTLGNDSITSTFLKGNINFATSSSLSFGESSILSDSAGTLTLSNVDALDTTTETTVETAIDTLSNLTSVGTITTGTWQGTIASTSLGSAINAATAKTTPADNDMFGLMDSAASNILKKFSWSSLKTAIQTFLEAATLTWTGTHNYSSATVTGIPFEKSWSIASTSPDYLNNTLATATTTWQVAHFAATTTLNSIRCESDTGTALVRIGDGTNWTAGVACGTAPTRNSSLSNNTFVPEEDYIIEIGTGASSPNWVTVDMELQR